jgi:DNA invertase Pin-like site-specific DNA recombinase
MTSTDGQTTENQRRELEAVAARSGWEVVDIYEDAGISGAKGRDWRPGFDRLLKDVTSRKINLIAAWSVDRRRRLTWEKYHQIKARTPLLKPKLRLPYAELQALAVL